MGVDTKEIVWPSCGHTSSGMCNQCYSLRLVAVSSMQQELRINRKALRNVRAERDALAKDVKRLNADLDDVPDLVAKLSTTRQSRDALAKLLIVKGKCVRCGCGDNKHDGTCDATPYLLDVALDEEWLRGIQEASG